MATERLLTYAQAAARMGISEPAFRDRARRKAFPDGVLVDRPRGKGMRPERFVLLSAFEKWQIAPQLEETAETKEQAQ